MSRNNEYDFLMEPKMSPTELFGIMQDRGITTQEIAQVVCTWDDATRANITQLPPSVAHVFFPKREDLQSEWKGSDAVETSFRDEQLNAGDLARAIQSAGTVSLKRRIFSHQLWFLTGHVEGVGSISKEIRFPAKWRSRPPATFQKMDYFLRQVLARCNYSMDFLTGFLRANADWIDWNSVLILPEDLEDDFPQYVSSEWEEVDRRYPDLRETIFLEMVYCSIPMHMFVQCTDIRYASNGRPQQWTQSQRSEVKKIPTIQNWWKDGMPQTTSPLIRFRTPAGQIGLDSFAQYIRDFFAYEAVVGSGTPHAVSEAKAFATKLPPLQICWSVPDRVFLSD